MEADKTKITQREITEEMRESYLDYAMSVIVARALPDVRDGLKPVHRRILYVMKEMGLTSGAKFTKCANIVGQTLGRYHPHGDMAVYDALVRLAQDFSLRYPLIQGQGNFGSIDGDSAAAYRYTEAKLTRVAEALIEDIDKNTVDFQANYDGTRQEPKVLPASLPQLLLNGTLGIAVGMATNIPPHNLGEVIDALAYLVDHPKSPQEELFQFIKGPDFPTGGIIFGQKEIAQAYASGRGPILMRGQAEIVERKNKQFDIVITEIPYQVVKAELVTKIAELVRDKKIEGIRDIRDESDKEGLRVVVELKSDSQPQKVLNSLYTYTDLEKTFHLNMLALVDGIQPEVLPIRRVLEEYLKHRIVVITRRTEFDLAEAKKRAHILEGLAKALDKIDAVIKTIRASKDRPAAHKALVSKFKFTDQQAEAILEMRLQTLAGLEREKIYAELKEKKKLIEELTALLENPKKIRAAIKKELLTYKEKFADLRRTKVVAHGPKVISEEELIKEEEVIITLTKSGYIKRNVPQAFRTQKRGGKGVSGIETKEEDMVVTLVTANTHDDLLFFTNLGKVHQLKAYEIPEASRVAKGKPLGSLLALSTEEQVTSVVARPVRGNPPQADVPHPAGTSNGARPKGKRGEQGFVVLVTRRGIMKRVEAKEFANIKRGGLIAIKLSKDDELAWTRLSSGKDAILLVTRLGQSLRFKETDIRPLSRQAAGVKAIRLKEKDELISMGVIPTDGEANKREVLIITENGFGKKTHLSQFRLQKRGGLGIKAVKVTAKNGKVVAAKVLAQVEEMLFVISEKGQIIKMPLSSLKTQSRASQGLRIMKLESGDRAVSATTI